MTTPLSLCHGPRAVSRLLPFQLFGLWTKPMLLERTQPSACTRRRGQKRRDACEEATSTGMKETPQNSRRTPHETMVQQEEVPKRQLVKQVARPREGREQARGDARRAELERGKGDIALRESARGTQTRHGEAVDPDPLKPGLGPGFLETSPAVRKNWRRAGTGIRERGRRGGALAVGAPSVHTPKRPARRRFGATCASSDTNFTPRRGGSKRRRVPFRMRARQRVPRLSEKRKSRERAWRRPWIRGG